MHVQVTMGAHEQPMLLRITMQRSNVTCNGRQLHDATQVLVPHLASSLVRLRLWSRDEVLDAEAVCACAGFYKTLQYANGEVPLPVPLHEDVLVDKQPKLLPLQARNCDEPVSKSTD